ncbi:MAG: hypothetical protein IMF08_06945 [Proteobacteria bacterium]|nr:hypothetical protein [Pseudomonadota bacterium]
MNKSILKMISLSAASLATILTMQSVAFAAEEHIVSIRRDVVPQVRSWLADSSVISAINNQNMRHASLDQTDIERLDNQWRSETSSSNRELVNAVLSNSLSSYLGDVKNGAGGLYSEIFIMDDKGLNVGQSDVTSDYWQGDEDKWIKTYLAGPDAVFIDEVKFDESTQTFQSQLSLSVIDPMTGMTIGAVTVGVNVDMLQ